MSENFIYPGSDPGESSGNIPVKTPGRGKLWFLPPTLRQVVQYFLPRRGLTSALINKIRIHECDALVLRTDIRQPMIAAIKKACPDTVICLEINAADFDESYFKVPFRSFFQKWEVRRYDRADAIMVVSSYLKSYLEERGIRPEKILVNQNGVNAAAIDHTGSGDVKGHYGIPKDAFVIGYIGGMEPFRRLPELVHCIGELRRAGNDDIYFLVVGDGADMPAVQAAIEAERDSLLDSVKCVGWRKHAEIPKFLATFDLAVFPFTNAYCSPLKLFEYLGAGLPTIGPDTPAVREVFEDGVHLRLVKQDGSDFIETVLELKNRPQLSRELGRKGRQLVLSEYTWGRNAERVVGHIRAMRQ
ncbi:MAG: glycosyltransferase family 4 protein [Gammaproteobacteria bacterium]|nr:MAG: glycosyltransferase family 4 protein [Gammaproteobacteria bacterium]